MSAPAVLRSPADPDHFRVQVGQFGDRHYIDTLPGDASWPAFDRAVPSVTTVGKASGQDWSFLEVKNIAERWCADRHVFDRLSDTAVHAVLKAWKEERFKQNTGRGTKVHDYIDARFRGLDAPLLVGDALAYRDAVEAWLDAYQPELLASECVGFNRHALDVGYGGTFDAIVTLNVDRQRKVLCDWKSRNADHAAYPHDAMQVGLYAGFDYIIVVDDQGDARRQDMIEVDDALIVSIKTDGVRMYPIDLALANEYGMEYLAWWRARRSETKAIGKPWAPTAVRPTLRIVPSSAAAPDASSASEVSRREQLRSRIQQLVEQGHGSLVQAFWPVELVPLKRVIDATDEYLDRVLGVVHAVEDQISAPFHGDDAPEMRSSIVRHPSNTSTLHALRDTIDEGEPAPAVDLDDLQQAMRNLSPLQQRQIVDIAREANAAGCSISLSQLPSKRRYQIARALFTLMRLTWRDAEQSWDDELVRALLATVLGNAGVRSSLVNVAHVFGVLTIEQAGHIEQLANALGSTLIEVRFDEAGTLVLAGPAVEQVTP